MAKDTALDNLWNTTDDTYVYHTVGSPAKMVKKAGNVLMGKRTKVQGYLTYFLPKDKKGKATGKPQRFLRVQKLGQTTNDFIPFDVVTPYYEDILKNKNYWASLGGSNLVQLAQNKLSGYDQNAIASKFSGANGVNINNTDDYGINSNLLDRGSLLNVNNALEGINYSSISAIETISDPNVSVVDADTMNQAYKESGSKTTFKDWINSEGGKGILNEITLLANALVNQPNLPQSGVPIGNVPTNKPEEDNKPKTETKILGMSPVTFGIVAVGIIAVGTIVTVMMIKSKNAKLKVA
jgi:hypothetical protein